MHRPRRLGGARSRLRQIGGLRRSAPVSSSSVGVGSARISSAAIAFHRTGLGVPDAQPAAAFRRSKQARTPAALVWSPPQYAQEIRPGGTWPEYDECRRKMQDIIVTDHGSWFVGKLANKRSVRPCSSVDRAAAF